MKPGFYLRLAWQGVRKNGRLYVPYLLTCSGMIAVTYILFALSRTPALAQTKFSAMGTILALGSFVICVFSLLLLFYTHSFLIRRRNREFGLYNILGMGKGNLARVLFWETAITALISLCAGLFAGVALSKLAELALVSIIGVQASYSFYISLDGLRTTGLFFTGVFLLIYISSLLKLRFSSAVQLIRSEQIGEKPPKANWLLGLVGFVMLGAAYAMAVSIKNPLSALSLFFAAVLMVIAASYLIFISGSVLLCRLLQKSKRFYYRADHFVSVSSMAYRMKRNGAGLASVCILATMVLVMLSSTTCLHFGAEDSLRNRYPRDLMLCVSDSAGWKWSPEELENLQGRLERCAREACAQPENLLSYRMAELYGMLENDALDPTVSGSSMLDLMGYEHVSQLCILPLEDYNRQTGAQETLAPGQALVYAYRTLYHEPRIGVRGGPSWEIQKYLDTFTVTGNAAMNIVPTLFVIVPDYDAQLPALTALTSASEYPAVTLSWSYGFDTALGESAQRALANAMRSAAGDWQSWMQEKGCDVIFSSAVDSAATERFDFYATYGGLFFLGVMLSIVFILGAVLILYYKQISEGYEDQARFEIMQKVGMTKQDIRKTVNSQLLMVFFLPLLLAGVHLGFAFPFIYRLLMLFNLSNLPLLLGTTAVSYLAFAALYIAVYRATSNGYYKIVTGLREPV